MTAGPNRWIQWLLLGVASVLLALHGAGWIATVSVLWQTATLHFPRAQSAVVVCLGLLVLRAVAARRRDRRRVVLCVLVSAAVAFVAMPLPRQFEGESLMPGGDDLARSRQRFEARFGVGHGGPVNFHSHLGDVALAALDSAFGRSAASASHAFDALSRLAGLLFLLELGAVAAWHRWSRRICRYVGLVIATPLCLLFFGYRELGYLSMAAGVVPLFALARSRGGVQTDASTLAAGFLQGFHTALHGFGILGIGGGVLVTLGGPGGVLRRLLRSASFASSAVALYLGWIFLYFALASLPVVWSRQLGYRPLFESMVFDDRIANPLFSQAGLGEFGLFSALSGVPLLALAVLSSSRVAAVAAILYALPGLLFLVNWWPVSAPFNLDLLLSVFPGLFAACWAVASSHRRSMIALVMLVGLHVLLWTTVGNGAFARVWVADVP